MREHRKKAPKTFAKLDKRWDIKMLDGVIDFTHTILRDVNPRLKKLAKKDEWIIDAPTIEEKLWPLLRKVRRITQNELTKIKK